MGRWGYEFSIDSAGVIFEMALSHEIKKHALMDRLILKAALAETRLMSITGMFSSRKESLLYSMGEILFRREHGQTPFR